METVATERLIIRRFAESDLADLLAYQAHPETYLHLAAEPMSEEKAVGFLARQASPDTWTGGGWLALAVYHPGDARVIGEVGVFVEAEPKSEGNIGWLMHTEYQGLGYATEAARVLVGYAFKERGLHRLTSGCDTRNTASWRLMERLGMRREAHYRQSQLTRGVRQDEYLYALRRDEWLLQHRIEGKGRDAALDSVKQECVLEAHQGSKEKAQEQVSEGFGGGSADAPACLPAHS